VFKVVYIPPEAPEPPPENETIPDLDCSGSLSWTDIKPGATVVGSFQVQNIGDNASLLNWTVNTSSISWGTWSCNPESGVRLTPEDGSVTVLVSVVAPNESETDFQGFLRVENIDDPTNFDTIPVTLTTPVNIIPQWLTFFQQLLSNFLHTHPFLETLINNYCS